ncbi:MAG: hypothetical protein IJZ72_01235 [Oscillospiraceae bacterium]|nr:hypothetical protein [Oscillospiraceae bacterium]
MIKGVNRRIVEITGMKNDYFEKAVLYIRPEKYGTSDTRLELEARCTAGRLSAEQKELPVRKKLPFTEVTLRLAAAAAIALSLALILFLIFG